RECRENRERGAGSCAPAGSRSKVRAVTRAWRLLLAFAVACTTWLVSTPALAAAPLCDTRGATVFAPAPTLHPPPASIDVGGDDASCIDLATAESLRRGAPPAEELDDPSQAVLSLTDVWLHPGSLGRGTSFAVAAGSRPGMRCPIERPPRIH